ncbi:MAG: carbamoyl-phosphate synthase small subunit [Deltaproteobacteria bacterium]|nr:MAG: carbamoyl-phosphate synthase small subunit [Deltaproteobacteria bacterium]
MDPAVLVLEDGRVFRGLGFGARATVVGEVVFNTSMTGYQEILTDPSYTGQLVCLTAVQIGNVGTNPDDEESAGHGAEGLIVRAASRIVANHRSTMTLPEWLAARGIPSIGEIDTRALTRHLRERGAMRGALSTETTNVERLRALACEAPAMEGRALGDEVSTSETYIWQEPEWSPHGAATAPASTFRAVVVDLGVKRNILRCLRSEGVEPIVVPAGTPADEILDMKPDGVFLSNGPGDPAPLAGVVAMVRDLLERAPDLPIYGICLGHQILALALGGRTYKLKFGHHGANHPVRFAGARRVAITSQNHGFVVDADSFGTQGRVTAINLFDETVAGMALADRPVAAVQFHPEAAPGPHDARNFFRDFVRAMERRAR